MLGLAGRTRERGTKVTSVVEDSHEAHSKAKQELRPYAGFEHPISSPTSQSHLSTNNLIHLSELHLTKRYGASKAKR